MSLKSRRTRLGVAASALLCALALSACSGDDGEDGGGGNGGQQPGSGAAPGPCDLTEPSVVAEVFGGTVAAEKPGAARNCEYAVQGGTVAMVNVYYYGTAAEWDGIRGGYETNRGPLTDAASVGEAAFHPADIGADEIVVRAGDVVFAVGIGIFDRSTDSAAKVKELAQRIATSVG